MENKGKFNHLSLPKMIMFAGHNRLTCTLLLKTYKKEFKIFFERGKIAFVSSTDKDERFGEYLLYRKKITFQQYALTSEKLMQEGGRLGYLLVKQGFITFEELLSELIEYMYFLIEKIFNVKSGSYIYLKPVKNETLPMELHIDVRKLVYHGIRNQMFFSTVHNYIPNLDIILSLSENSDELLKTLTLDVNEQTVVEWVNGKNKISSICDYSPVSEYETLAILAALIACGFVKEVTDARKMFSEAQLEFEVEDLLKKYNGYYQILYSFLMSHGENTFNSIQNNAFKTLNEVFKGEIKDINLNNYGYIDFESFYKIVYNLPHEKRVKESEKILKELLKELIFETGNLLGKAEMNILKEMIRK